MSEDRPEELKGWPRHWYVDWDEENGDLKCPAPKCGQRFITATEVENRLEHPNYYVDTELDIQHVMLLAMCQVTKCPKCPEDAPPVRTLRDVGEHKTDSDIRALLKHERDVHKSEDLTNMQKCIGFVRLHRHRLFGAKDMTRAILLWTWVDKYYRREIVKHPEFENFKAYLREDFGLSLKDGEDWLGEMNKASRDTEFPGELSASEIRACQNYFPVDPETFLKPYRPKNRKSSGRQAGTHVWDKMKASYWAGII